MLHHFAMGELSEAEGHTIAEWLSANEFTVADQSRDAPFGDQHDDWVRLGLMVRIVRDRGQWFAELSRQGWGTWFDIDLVAIVLGDRSVDALSRVIVAAGALTDDHLLPALTSLRKERAADRLRSARDNP
jgi:hypothetical protein